MNDSILDDNLIVCKASKFIYIPEQLAVVVPFAFHCYYHFNECGSGTSVYLNLEKSQKKINLEIHFLLLNLNAPNAVSINDIFLHSLLSFSARKRILFI